MNKILIISLLITNLFWIYILINRSVTIDHLQMEMNNMNKSNKLIQKIALDLIDNKQKSHIIQTLKENYKNSVIKEDDIDKNIVHIDQLILRFQDNVLLDLYYE